MSYHRRQRDCETSLKRLAAAINKGETPLQARVERTVGGPTVRVVNPEANRLTEWVSCRPEPLDGDRLWYWWEWGTSIGPAVDVEGVAAAIARVLGVGVD